MTKRSNWFKAYIVDVLPCISVAFYILAYVYHSSFYSVFGIDIIRYTTFGDLFLSITEPLLIYALFTAFIVCILFELYTNTLPAIIQQEEERKKKSLSFNKYRYWYLRLLVKIRECKLTCYLKKKFTSNEKKNLRRTELLLPIIISVIFFLLCLYVLMNLIRDGNLEPTLLSSAIALIIPILIILLYYFTYILLFPQIIANFQKNIKQKYLYIIVFAVFYYIYAIIVFSLMGYCDGERIKEKNMFKFEIRTMSGKVYTDKDYGYIDHMYDYTYLFDKKTKENVILEKDGIESTKLIDMRPNRFTYIKKVNSVFNQ